jgi:hypothetical protein
VEQRAEKRIKRSFATLFNGNLAVDVMERVTNLTLDTGSRQWEHELFYR